MAWILKKKKKKKNAAHIQSEKNLGNTFITSKNDGSTYGVPRKKHFLIHFFLVIPEGRMATNGEWNKLSVEVKTRTKGKWKVEVVLREGETKKKKK